MSAAVGAGALAATGPEGAGSADAAAGADAPEKTRRKRPDVLGHAVFEDLEVGLREIADRLPAPVPHDDVDDHGRDRLANRAAGALRGLLRVPFAHQCENHGQGTNERPALCHVTRFLTLNLAEPRRTL